MTWAGYGCGAITGLYVCENISAGWLVEALVFGGLVLLGGIIGAGIEMLIE